MLGKLQESDILFANVVQNSDRARPVIGQPNDLSPRPAQFSLQRLDAPSRSAKSLLKQLLKNVHRLVCTSRATTKDNIEAEGAGSTTAAVYLDDPGFKDLTRSLPDLPSSTTQVK